MLGGYYLGQLYLGISGLPSAGVLSAVPSSHQLSSDNLTLTQKHTLVVDSDSHTLASGNITLTQKHLLVVEDAIHTLMSENVALTSEHFLGVNDAFHGLESTEIHLTQKHTIVVDNTSHTVNSDNLELTEHKTLVVQNTTHNHIADAVVLAVKSYLDVDNTIHGHTVNNILLFQKHLLSVANTLHGVTSTSIGGLLSIEPFGFGGGFGAIEAWGVKQFGEINIELPINFLILNLDSNHSVSSDSLNTFIQIFNMIRTGIYIRDFNDDGYVGDEYIKDSGVAIVNKPKLGKLTNQFNALIDETAEFILLSEADEVLIENIYDGYKFIFMTNRGSEGVFQLDNNKESGTLLIDNITNGELNKIIGEDSEYAYIKSNKHEGII